MRRSGKRSASTAAIQRLAKSLAGIRVVWSPVNNAWMVLWGKSRTAVKDLSILRVITRKDDVLDYLKSLKGS